MTDTFSEADIQIRGEYGTNPQMGCTVCNVQIGWFGSVTLEGALELVRQHAEKCHPDSPALRKSLIG